MPIYFVDDHPQPNGYHQVHKAGCLWLPYIKSKTSLGYFTDCREAVQTAWKYYRRINGCDTCSPACHRSRQRPE